MVGPHATGRGRELLMFRCFYHPTDRYGSPVPMPSGDLPSIDVAASSRDEAESKAFSAVRMPITETQRLDGIPVPKAPRKPRQRKVTAVDLAALGLKPAASLLPKESS
jgi:hypothetical protein